ncbi:hypothetical protein CAOG_05755 [Capsaspora owczarzaki ATCC 30864]|uniref:BTB domain-containing protein n=1 Tax=Capsaspora owczarzaki (strain ATCC 30864) TaxID=595528 RepID=A0A0D2UJK5_CAPO3|nr:hypothetical protein CAOG_05755 [Capsaspora owczarzaki ATCC 30864]KJE95286.1 hypothetical protein CAOG_005755 [Capsaspora owczarzaki ATCC 30864]|eukprot:XP_004346428.1 hypothetical protein CAOG_05755 [Capsaspora owczarzaki ATCC 30864]
MAASPSSTPSPQHHHHGRAHHAPVAHPMGSDASPLSAADAAFQVFLLAAQLGRRDDLAELHDRLASHPSQLQGSSAGTSATHGQRGGGGSASSSEVKSRPRLLNRAPNASSSTLQVHGTTGQGRGVSDIVNRTSARPSGSGITALMLAATGDHIHAATWLLEQGAQVNAVDAESNWSSLHRALYMGQIQTAILLIAAGADVHLKDAEGMTPLDLIARDREWPFRVRPTPVAPLALPLRRSSPVVGDAAFASSPAASDQHESASLSSAASADEPAPSSSSSVFDKPSSALAFYDMLISTEQLLEGADVFSWGLDRNYTLGHVGAEDRNHPDRVDAFVRMVPRARIVSAVTSSFHSAFLTDAGEVYTCGFGLGGRLGHDCDDTVIVPRRVGGLLDGKACAAVSVSRDNSAVVTSKGEVFTFGSNEHGQLGVAGLPVGPHANCPKPQLVKALRERKVPIIGVACGRTHSAFYSEQELYTCGQNFGQLGHAQRDPRILAPKAVPAVAPTSGRISQVVASDTFTACLTSVGDIFVCHSYAVHRLRLPTTIFRPNIVVFRQRKPVPFRIVAGHGSSLLCVATDGSLFIWLPWLGTQFVHLAFGSQRALNVIDVAMGVNQMAVVSAEGNVYVGNSPDLDRMLAKAKALATSHNLVPAPFTLHPSLVDALTVPTLNVYRTRNLHRTVSVSCNPQGSHFLAVTSATMYARGPDRVKVLPSQARTDFGALLTSHSSFTSDMHLVSSDAEIYGTIPAHTAILASRAPQWFGALEKDEALTQELAAAAADPFALPQTSYELIAPTPSSAHEEGESPTKSVMEAFLVPELPQAALLALLEYLYTGTCDLLELPLESKQRPTTSQSRQASGKEGGGKKKGNKARSSSQDHFTAPPSDADSEHQALTSHEIARTLCDFSLKHGMTELHTLLSSKLETRYMGRRSLRGAIPTFRVTLGTPDVDLLSAEDEHIPVHKAILVARCEYFAAMFGSPFWSETGAARPALGLPSPTPLRALTVLVDYMYTDSVDLTARDPVSGAFAVNVPLAFEVLVVANVLLLERLKSLCEGALATCVDIKTVVSFLDMAAVYQCTQLKEACLSFILHNLEAVLEARQLESLLGGSKPANLTPVESGLSSDSPYANDAFFADLPELAEDASEKILDELGRRYRSTLPPTRRPTQVDLMSFHSAAAAAIPQRSAEKMPAGSMRSSANGKRAAGASTSAQHNDSDEEAPPAPVAHDGDLARQLQEQEDAEFAAALAASFVELDDDERQQRADQAQRQQQKSRKKAAKLSDRQKQQAAQLQEEVAKRKQIQQQSLDVEEPAGPVAKPKKGGRGIRVDLSNPDEALRKIAGGGDSPPLPTVTSDLPTPAPWAATSAPAAPATASTVAGSKAGRGAAASSLRSIMSEQQQPKQAQKQQPTVHTAPVSQPAKAAQEKPVPDAKSKKASPAATTAALPGAAVASKSGTTPPLLPSSVPLSPASPQTAASILFAPKSPAAAPSAQAALETWAAKGSDRKLSQRERKRSQSRDVAEHTEPAVPESRTATAGASVAWKSASPAAVQQTLSTNHFPSLGRAPAVAPSPASPAKQVSLTQIHQEQRQLAYNADAVKRKALDLIQLEEKAIAAIEAFYAHLSLEEETDEMIVIERVVG